MWSCWSTAVRPLLLYRFADLLHVDTLKHLNRVLIPYTCTHFVLKADLEIEFCMVGVKVTTHEYMRPRYDECIFFSPVRRVTIVGFLTHIQRSKAYALSLSLSVS